MFKSAFFLFAVVGLTLTAQASETLNYGIHQHYITPRAMGMGNTFSGIDDHNVLFYNPAGLAYLEDKTLNISIGGAIAPDTLDFAGDISDLADSNASDADKIQEIGDFLKTKYGETYTARAQPLNFIYTRPRWGLALIPVDLSVTLMPHQLAGPALDVTAYQDTTLAFGWAKKSKKNFSWGFLGKAIYRANVDKSLLAVDLAGDGDVVRDQDFKEGMTVDFDAGVMWNPYQDKTEGVFRKVKPTFSAVVRNILDYGFTSNFELYNEGSSRPEKLHRRIDLGSKWVFPQFSVFKPSVMIDVRDILHEHWSVGKGFHTGAELQYNVGRGLLGSFQLGLNQMHWTAGVGIQTWFFKVELTTFAEEYGTRSEEKAVRTYLAQINFNF